MPAPPNSVRTKAKIPARLAISTGATISHASKPTPVPTSNAAGKRPSKALSTPAASVAIMNSTNYVPIDWASPRPVTRSAES